jgi:hypothetical protein
MNAVFGQADRFLAVLGSRFRCSSSVSSSVSAQGGTTLDVELPAAQAVVDEPTGKALEDGKTFSFDWRALKPVFFSYASGD